MHLYDQLQQKRGCQLTGRQRVPQSSLNMSEVFVGRLLSDEIWVPFRLLATHFGWWIGRRHLRDVLKRMLKGDQEFQGLPYVSVGSSFALHVKCHWAFNRPRSCSLLYSTLLYTPFLPPYLRTSQNNNHGSWEDPFLVEEHVLPTYFPPPWWSHLTGPFMGACAARWRAARDLYSPHRFTAG